jgi:hypothetical protein
MSLWSVPWHPPARTLRQFAGLWLLFGGALAVRVALAFGPFPGSAVAVAAVAGGVAGLLWPRSVRPLFLALTILTWPVGWVVSHLVLLVLFYGVFTPVGLLFWVIGRDSLERRFRPECGSYWQPKAMPADPARYLKSF